MISLIAACAKNRVIGKDGSIPWRIPEELRYFHDVTMGGAVIMGRKTYESIGRPLQGRLNIVISHSKVIEEENVITVPSAEEALKAAEGKEVFICGGQSVYEEMLPLAERLYITEIELEPPGDAFFPEFDEGDYVLISEKRVPGEIPYTIKVYDRRN
ncbi:MAG: dihydrofolate reductase [Eubacteriales bacterium]|nr:dihydrofolate reductase [Eubacteriales bacterium]